MGTNRIIQRLSTYTVVDKVKMKKQIAEIFNWFDSNHVRIKRAKDKEYFEYMSEKPKLRKIESSEMIKPT